MRIVKSDDTFEIKTTGCGCCAESSYFPRPYWDCGGTMAAGEDFTAITDADLDKLQQYLQQQLETLTELRRLKNELDHKDSGRADVGNR